MQTVSKDRQFMHWAQLCNAELGCAISGSADARLALSFTAHLRSLDP